MVHLEERVSALAPRPPRSLKAVLTRLTECSKAELLSEMRSFKGQYWERCTASHWHRLLNRFDDILAAFADPEKRAVPDAPTSELVCEVLRVLYDCLSQQAELKSAFASGDRLRDLLDCTDLAVVLGALRCFSICLPGRHLRGTHGAAAERRLEALACGTSLPGSLYASCSRDGAVRDFAYEVPRGGTGDAHALTELRLPAAKASTGVDQLVEELVASHRIADAYLPALRLQLGLWSHARSLAGRREVVAMSLYSLCNAVKHLGPGFLHQHMQKRPGLFSELCEVLQNLQAVGEDVGVAALRVAGAILDTRYGQSRSEVSQFSQMLGLSVPHGIVACALRGLLAESPPTEQLPGHYRVLMSALDLFQITTASPQTTVQLGHAGMILAMLDLMQKTDVVSLPAVVAMLRCLELAAEVSASTALLLFREFRGLPAFSARLQQEVDLLMALDFTGDVYDGEPPGTDATDQQRAAHWNLLEEVTARRRLCRQLLKNIQVALQCQEVVQAGLANVFQGPLMDVLKRALEEPQKVGLCLFGIAVDIVSNLIQDDPSRVPQMIESGVLPGILGALSKETMRSVECLSFVPGVLASATLHAVGEDFVIKARPEPLRLLTEILVDPSYAPLLHSQPELAQIMSTHVDKVLRNKPSGTSKLTDHVVECIIDAMKTVLEQAKQYPDWTPTDLEDHTEFLADRLAAFGRFCWSVLGTNEHTLGRFLEKNGLPLIQELHELPCLPYQLCSLEGQPHPLGSLFNLQAAGPAGNTAVLGALQEMLKSHHTGVMDFMNAHLQGAGDPYKVLAEQVAGGGDGVKNFLRSLSGLTSVLEGLQAVCREGAAGASVQMLDALHEPVKKIREVAPKLLALAAWRPREKEGKNSLLATYTELAKNFYTEKTEDNKDKDKTDAAVSMEVDSDASTHLKATLYAARQCLSLSAQTVRQFLVLICKQLHSRTRQREVTAGLRELAYELADVCKGMLSVDRPSDLQVSLRWAGDVFDLLLKMHEEQNRVAIRPLCLCTFYQKSGFTLVAPLLQYVAKHLDQEPGPAALCSGMTYLEKVTSHKRFINAVQVNLLRAEDGLIPKDQLCRSVQGEALKCVLPVWRQGDFSKFPDNIGQSLMKVWLHTFDGPRDIPARPLPAGAAGASGAASAAPAAGGRPPVPPTPPPAGSPLDALLGLQRPPMRGMPGTGTATMTQAVIGTLVDMGFAREQVERGMQHLNRQGNQVDVGALIQWMVSNEGGEDVPASSFAAALAAVAGPAGVLGATPAAAAATAPASAAPPAGAGAAGGTASDKLRPMTTEEFQAQVSDMLTDLLPRLLMFGRQVPKAVGVVADTLAFIIVGVPSPLWGEDKETPRKSPQEENAAAVVKACLNDLGEDNLLPSADALACVAQILASLLHRRPQVSTALGPEGMAALLAKLHKWSLMSIDFCVLPFARGYRTVCFGSAAPAPPGIGEPLLAAPPWLTPVVVCAHQLLCLADLVKIRDTKKELDEGIQRNWVTRVLHIVYAFPGMDGGLAMACLQVLSRLCSTTTGKKAFLEYQPRLLLDPSGSSLKAPAETPGGLLLLLRLARKASFPGLLQMLADFVLLLLEDGPLLQQRMETEILALFANGRPMQAKDISKQLYPLLSRNPDLFEEALKAVTQRPHDAGAGAGEALVVEPIPEGERPQRGRLKLLDKSPVPLLVLQTLLSEACYGLEIQHRTAFQKVYDIANKEDKKGEEAKSKESSGAAEKLPPTFPLALGPDSMLYLLDFVLTRISGLSVLLLKPPAALPPGPYPVPSGDGFLLVDAPAIAPQKSLLLVMTRHLLPRFARLSELWIAQVEVLTPSERQSLSQPGTSPVQRCLPHLGACLCSAARHANEPRRCLVLEAMVALKVLAEGPGLGADGPQRGSYAAQVAAVASLVSRLLGAAAAADRKDDKEPDAAGAAQDEAGSRPGTAERSERSTNAKEEAATPKRSKSRKDTGFFNMPGETQALREALVSIVSHMDLYRSESSMVATTVVKCLEFLTRREPSRKEGSAERAGTPAESATRVGVIGDEPMEHVERFGAEEEEEEGDPFQGEYGGEGEDEEDEEEDDDEDMGDDGDGGLDGAEEMDAMGMRDDGPMGEDPGVNDDEEEEDYEEDVDEDDFGEVGDEMAEEAPNGLAAILNNAISVFDQQGLDPNNMTLRVDIDLGEAGVIHGISHQGRFRQLPGGVAGNLVGGRGPAPPPTTGGWSEPGDLDVPTDHPLLRRDAHHHGPQQGPGHHHHHHRGGGNLDGHWIHFAPGSALFFGTEPPPQRPAPSNRTQQMALEGFDEAFGALSGRLMNNMRTASAPPPAAAAAANAAGGASPAAAAAASTASPAAAAAEAPAVLEAAVQARPEAEAMPAAAAEAEAAPATGPHEVPLPVPMETEPSPAAEIAAVPEAPVAGTSAEPVPSPAASAEAPAQVPVPEAAALEAASTEEAVPAAEVAPAEPEEDYGVPELTRLADHLGCSQLQILRAAEIDPSVVRELPEEMRSMIVMAQVSQVNLDHLRRPASARPASGGTAAGGDAQGAAAADEGFGEIDAAVLEALPPDIREEVLREERARQRERERAAQRAAAAAAAPAAGGGAAGGAASPGAQGADMDTASFIASLDPILREEVLMTAPEELLQTLPPELVAEAQLIRDRSFARIAARREVPAVPQASRVVQQPQPVVRPPPRQLIQHQYLQAMEQQMAQGGPGSRRHWMVGDALGDGRNPNLFGFSQEMLRHIGNIDQLRQFRVPAGAAPGGQQQHIFAVGGTQGPGAGPAGAQGLSSFDVMDRQLLERLVDYDEELESKGPQPELPLALPAIPTVCRLLYLRQEIAVTPMTRLFFNLMLHPQTRNCVLGHFVFLLSRRPVAGASPLSLPPPHLLESLEGGRAPQVNTTEIQAVGSQRILSVLAYLLRRIPQCGEFFAKQWSEEKWREVLQGTYWTPGSESKDQDEFCPEERGLPDLPNQHCINLLLQLLATKLYLSSSQHATWLLSILHALLVHHKASDKAPEAAAAGAAAMPTAASAPSAGTTPAPAAASAGGASPALAPEGTSPAVGSGDSASSSKPPTVEEQSLKRWSKITKDMHSILSQPSVLALCHFLCQAGTGHGSSGDGDTFQMATDILVVLASSQEHLDMVRSELMRVLEALVRDIEASLAKCEVMTAEPSTLETRFLRVVRALGEVFKEATKRMPEKQLTIDDFLDKAQVENLWVALDRTLDHLADTEVMSTPAQRLLSSGAAPSAVREAAVASAGLNEETKAHFASNVQATPPKPLLNRLLPLIEAFFVLHDGNKEAEQEKKDKEEKAKAKEQQESQEAMGTPTAAHVFSEVLEVSLVENSRLGQFCKRHRRPLNALVKQTPTLLSKSFSPLLRLMPMCLDFDNKRANFRGQLRNRRLESRHETIRLRVRRSEIFIDSYHQLRQRTGEEMRAKIQVQFQGEEGIDAGGVLKEWYTSLAREIFNPNYALFVQAGGKACTYHPNPMSYVNRDHLQFFQFIGRVVGKAIHDGQNLEAWFTRGFYKHMLQKKVIPADLEAFDPEYFSNLKWMLDHDITNIIELTFCAESDELGQMKTVDLKPNGRSLPVTNDNKHEYIQLMAEHKMTNSVRQQIDAFLKGLHEIVPPEMLSVFDDKELELLISGLPDIDIEDLKANTEYHNYTPQSEQVQWFWKVMSEFTQEQRAWFLQFATGTTRVPVEGFKGLIGMRGPQKFSIHRAYGADRLPSAHTCFNQLDLPDYPSEEVLREKLLQAVREGYEGFGFA